jgi:hypothetical protein
MRLPKEDRHQLLEEIFAPEDTARGVSADEVLRLVASARHARDRRRRAAVGVAAFAVVALWSVALWPRPRAVPAPAPVIAAARPVPAEVASISPPAIERVDDKAMLAMLGDRPAALVRWPDGRQGLLLLSEKRSHK